MMSERTAWRCVLRFRRAGIRARARQDVFRVWWVIVTPGGAYVAQHLHTVGRVDETLRWLTEPDDAPDDDEMFEDEAAAIARYERVVAHGR
jgi:hypothetical protein